MRWRDSTYLKRDAFSASLAILKLSRPAHTFTRRLLAKKPEPSPTVSAIPSSRKCFVDKRALGFGFNSLLYDGKMTCGIAPREDAAGAGCGGCAVGGSGCDGLKEK